MSDLVLEHELVASPGRPKRSYAAVRVKSRGENFYKCAVLRPNWRKSPRTDIRRGAPACELWKAKPVSIGGGLDQ